MFWDKEKIVTVYEKPESVEGDPYIRMPEESDKDPETMRIDRENGDFITLYQEKMRYPYKTRVASTLYVKTNLRNYEIKMDSTFIWNGQNIPTIFWSLIGISKDSPEGLRASKWHDYLLFKKEEILEDLKYKGLDIDFKQYRRLTTLIYRQLLKNNGVSTIKANIMAGAAGAWQFISPQWWGFEE